MATWKTVSDIARDLPGAELDTGSAGNAAWRVNGKIIVRRNPRLDGRAKKSQVDKLTAAGLA